ncbi:MAG TPA: MBL fold metallo-hydrolase [Opitutaceae bacterium]|nr:MBL fold metallo-hydrolase [Opitutaceae bacterium]
MKTLPQQPPRVSVVTPGVVHLPLGQGNDAWVLHDGSYTARPVEDCAWNASKPDVEAALADAGLPTDIVHLQVLPLLVRWNGELILIDPGCASAYGPNLGWMEKRLGALGISPGQINRVLFSHLHLDHVAGSLSDDFKALRYPNAKYAVAGNEWAFWTQSAPDLSQTKVPVERQEAIIQAIRPALETLGSHLSFFDAGDEIVRGLRAIDLAGHTPGQVGFKFARDADVSGSLELVYVADAMVDPSLHVPHPEWTLIGDSVPALVEKSRRKLLREAVERQQILAGYHFALPGFGTVREVGADDFRFSPLAWSFPSP